MATAPKFRIDVDIHDLLMDSSREPGRPAAEENVRLCAFASASARVVHVNDVIFIMLPLLQVPVPSSRLDCSSLQLALPDQLRLGPTSRSHTDEPAYLS